jgi:mannose-6-phosphate isomerase-like protein (cupin superfamily)
LDSESPLVSNLVKTWLHIFHANVVHFGMVKDQTRRNFFRTAPLAAAAVSLSFSDKSLFASAVPSAAAQAPETGPNKPFQIFTAKALDDVIRGVQADSGTKQLIGTKTTPFSITINSETNKTAKEFEYHEHRDHIFQVIDGTTVYELGGTPQNPRSTGPGEWLAPDSKGSESVTLRKGDMLIVPRGTPHRRRTTESVTLNLISVQNAI